MSELHASSKVERKQTVTVQLHSNGLLLAARIAILPFFSNRERNKSNRERKKAKCRFSQPKIARVNAAIETNVLTDSFGPSPLIALRRHLAS